ncbi:MAG: type II toxin-antitoxin system Y4mF family antitoxin [Parvibaculum sp.]|nr:type II toxin-antitoxin system Y4mF family antitoxin [Parvibaculum sp.]
MATRKSEKRTDASTIIVLDDLRATSPITAPSRHPQTTINDPEILKAIDTFTSPYDPAFPGAETPLDSARRLGEVIRAARTLYNLSQQELADMAGVGRRFVSELENGKATLEIGRVLTVCAALGIDLVARKR